MTRRRAVGSALLGVLALLLVAGPAAADPPGPTNYDSTVVGPDPAVDGLDVEVIGGDAFLQVRNVGGHEVVVPGYDDGEQYLRFDTDGSVWVNLRSAAYWQNDNRYGVAGSAIPADVGPEQPPRWERVSSDGTWAWHDHRIHWMSPTTLPGEVDPTLAERQPAFDWTVPLEVDGQSVAVVGALDWVPDASPVAAMVGLAVGLGLGVLLVVRRAGPTGIVGVVAVGVVATGVVGLASGIGLPPGVQAEPLPLVLTVIAAVVALAAWLVRDRTAAAGVLAGAAGLPLVVWALAEVGAVTAPVVPPAVLPSVVVRLAVGLAAGTGVAALVAGIRDLFTRPLTVSTTAAPPDPATGDRATPGTS